MLPKKNRRKIIVDNINYEWTCAKQLFISKIYDWFIISDMVSLVPKDLLK